MCVCAFGCCFVGANGCVPLTMLVDVCQCCCLLMFVCLPFLRHFPCCKNLENKESESEDNAKTEILLRNAAGCKKRRGSSVLLRHHTNNVIMSTILQFIVSYIEKIPAAKIAVTKLHIC